MEHNNDDKKSLVIKLEIFIQCEMKNNTFVGERGLREAKTAGVEMQLEDNGIGDVIEGENYVEIYGPFLFDKLV